MSTPLLYAGNADIKYPLSDFHETDIPNDLLLELSLSVPYDIDPVLTVIRTGDGFAFLVLEDNTTQLPVASVLVDKPEVATVVKLDMDVPGFGWAVFGPGLHTPYNSGATAVELAAECLTRIGDNAAVVLTVNGQEYDLAGLLEIDSAAGGLVSTRVDGNAIWFERVDSEMLPGQLPTLSTDGVSSLSSSEDAVYTLGNVAPDSLGNINIDIEGCAEACTNTLDLSLPRGDIGLGEPAELPLDKYMPRTYSAADQCKPSESSSSGEGEPSGPFDEACQSIGRMNIIDPGTDKAVGTLYTLQELAGNGPVSSISSSEQP